MCRSDFTNGAECENQKTKRDVHHARTFTPTGRWHLWTNGKGKENSLPNSSNIQLAGFISIPRVRTFNTRTLTFQMHLNMEAQMKITGITDPQPRGNLPQVAARCFRPWTATCRNLPQVAKGPAASCGNLRQVAAIIASRAVARQLAATCGNLPRKPPAATCRKLPRVAT